MNLPPGLMGMTSQVPTCGEPAASLGSCPQSSQIGSVTVGVGAGPRPVYLSGSMYLTGPYGGVPFGLSILVPAIVGPFNLGTIVARAQVKVSPSDMHLTIVTNPLPQILSGIPLRMRSQSLALSRSDFVVNPTNCSPMSVAATIGSAEGVSFPTSSPFQVSGCQGMPFAPKLEAATLGKASSRGNGASLDVKVTNAAGDHANLATVSVELPKSLKPRLSAVQQGCLAATFAENPGACPPASVVGSAVVDTPVLSVPLTGPVYQVFYRGIKYPDLVLILQGGGIEVRLTGLLNVNQGIGSATFKLLPDVPMSLFELDLPEGSHSILGATGNLCAKRQVVRYTLVGQNGTQNQGGAKVAVAGCRARVARASRRGRPAKASRARSSARIGGARHA